jgi:hypothetical protein
VNIGQFHHINRVARPRGSPRNLLKFKPLDLPLARRERERILPGAPAFDRVNRGRATAGRPSERAEASAIALAKAGRARRTAAIESAFVFGAVM